MVGVSGFTGALAVPVPVIVVAAIAVVVVAVIAVVVIAIVAAAAAAIAAVLVAATAISGAGDTRISGNIGELSTIGDGATGIGGAAAGGRKSGTHAERNSTGGTNGQVSGKHLGVAPLELIMGVRLISDGWANKTNLALEQSVELGVFGSLLAVEDGEGVGGVTRLLRKDLRERNKLGVVFERLGKIDHVVGGVLVVARITSSEEGCEGCDGNLVALRTTTGGSLIGEIISKAIDAK